MRLSLEQLATTPSSLNYLLDSAYDYAKWNLGVGMHYNNGASAEDKYIAPIFKAIRPSEESVGFVTGFPFTICPDNDKMWIWSIEITTAAATRRIMLHELNRKTGALSWKGFITLTFPTATNHTVRDFKIDYKKEITGTVAVSGTAVIGTNTLFATNRVAVGAIIGFGSTDPKQITQWYRVSSITDDLNLTLAASAGTIGAGTAFVIEEYRPVILTTNATTTNGGLFYAKGISIEDFIPTGGTIPAATTIDNIKAVYWLKDAAVETNIVGAGLALDFAAATVTNLNAYVINLPLAGNYNFFKYNIRAALAGLVAGASTSAFTLVTGNNTFTGTGSQNANLCIATANHGAGQGVNSLYFISTTRVMRAACADITSGSTTVISNTIIEVPTGGITTYTATAALTSIEYVSKLDAFLIFTTGVYHHLTKFVASGTEFDLIWARNQNNLEQSTKNNNSPLMVTTSAVVMTANDNSNSNLVVMAKSSITAGINTLYIINAGAHWNYAETTGYVISPEISTPNALKYYRVLANIIKWVGDQQFGKPTEPIEIYARTTNIQTDATSGWQLISQDGNLSAFAGAASIQFKVQYKTLGDTCIPARLLGFNLEYEDNTNDSHYALSVSKSDLVNKGFAFYFKTAFGGTVPTLTIRLYDADTGALLLTDTTENQTSGSFQKTINGSNWTAYDTNDKTNNTTWIKYTPTSLADNIKIMAVLSQG